MRLRVRLPHEVPEGVEIDPARVAKALRWAVHESWDPSRAWRLNSVPALAQLEEALFLDGQNGLAELYHDLTRGLGLPPYAEALEVLEKARRSRPMPDQAGSHSDTERKNAGGEDFGDA